MDINVLFKKFMQDPEFAQAFNEPLEEEYNETNSQGQILQRGDLSKYKISDEELEKVINRNIMENNLKENLTNNKIQEIANDIVDKMDSNLKDVNDETTDIEFEISTTNKKEISKIFRLLNDMCSDKYIDYQIENEETYPEGKYYYATLSRKYPDDYYFDYEDDETTWATQPDQRTGKYKISDKELEEVKRREMESLVEKSDVLKPIPESFAIIELSTFKKDWKRLGLDDSDLKDLKKKLKEIPPETHIGNGVYKFRFSPKDWNAGARDAGRGYYIEVIADTKAYLVTAYRKNEKGNLTPEETKNIRKLAKLLRSK